MKKWGAFFSGIGTIILSILTCIGCPMCIPIYAGFLSLIGVELADVHEYFFPIMLIFGLITLGFMAYQIYRHHSSWTPFKLAGTACIGMAISAFFGYEYVLYALLAIFMGSVIWSKRTLSHQGHECC
ncbi:MAG: MerC family mercury resistance protein [Alphaproteobacteria bacterium]|nr:MerC family mercury resistance protein [Alphaproteobacteria bacterium]